MCFICLEIVWNCYLDDPGSSILEPRRQQKHLYEISDKTRFFSMKHIPWKSKDHLNSSFFTKDYFLVGNFYHSKLGAIILIVFDFQGIDRSSCSFPKHQELLIHRHPSVSQVVRDALWGSPGYHVMIPRNIPTGIHFCLYLQTIYETSISYILSSWDIWRLQGRMLRRTWDGTVPYSQRWTSSRRSAMVRFIDFGCWANDLNSNIRHKYGYIIYDYEMEFVYI